MAYSAAWADLPTDLLARVADALTIDAHARVRAACVAWRAALPPAAPSLLALHNCERRKSQRRGLSAVCVSPWTTTALNRLLAVTLSLGGRCVGSGDGWIAVGGPLCLVNPLTGAEIYLYSFRGRRDQVWVSKVVFAPNPKPGDFTAAAITGLHHLAYTTAGNSAWNEVECPRLATCDTIADVLYHERLGGCSERAVYCLSGSGDLHVVRLPSHRDSQPEPAVIEPLFAKNSTEFDAAAAFAPPYDTISKFTSAKNLVIGDDGSLYQVWRNTTCDIIAPLTGGRGHYRIPVNQVFVLKSEPLHWPCWVAVKDLGGCSVFVGRNNAVAMRVDDGGLPGLRGNCVYWIGGMFGRDQGWCSTWRPASRRRAFPPCKATSPSAGTTWVIQGVGAVATVLVGHQLPKRARDP